MKNSSMKKLRKVKNITEINKFGETKLRKSLENKTNIENRREKIEDFRRKRGGIILKY